MTINDNIALPPKFWIKFNLNNNHHRVISTKTGLTQLFVFIWFYIMTILWLLYVFCYLGKYSNQSLLLSPFSFCPTSASKISLSNFLSSREPYHPGTSLPQIFPPSSLFCILIQNFFIYNSIKLNFYITLQ